MESSSRLRPRISSSAVQIIQGSVINVTGLGGHLTRLWSVVGSIDLARGPIGAYGHIRSDLRSEPTVPTVPGTPHITHDNN